jgi:GNAT superfamily N-acetyltransferase
MTTQMIISPGETGARQAAPQFGFTRAAAAGLTLRPMTDADLPFLARLYASTRMEELAPVDWPETQKAAFLQMQFDAQHAHYRQHYHGTDWLVILRAGEPVGRLYLARWAREHRIVDIALLPAHRRAGLGTALLHDLLDEAAAAGKPVTIHVEKFNPALRLYERLGFAAVEDKGVYDLMRWSNSPTARAKKSVVAVELPAVASEFQAVPSEFPDIASDVPAESKRQTAESRS